MSAGYPTLYLYAPHSESMDLLLEHLAEDALQRLTDHYGVR